MKHHKHYIVQSPLPYPTPTVPRETACYYLYCKLLIINDFYVN